MNNTYSLHKVSFIIVTNVFKLPLQSKMCSSSCSYSWTFEIAGIELRLIIKYSRRKISNNTQHYTVSPWRRWTQCICMIHDTEVFPNMTCEINRWRQQTLQTQLCQKCSRNRRIATCLSVSTAAKETVNWKDSLWHTVLPQKIKGESQQWCQTL